MFPIILSVTNQDKKEKFISEFISNENFLPYYVFRIEPVKTEISIDQIRAIKKEIIMAIPDKRLFIVEKFDSASLEAQNAFLKTLEERNESNQFILVVTDIGRVLPTIQSRSKVIALDANSDAAMNESVQNLINGMGRDGDYAFLGPVSSITREDAIKFFNHSVVVLRDQLTTRKSAGKVLKHALKQRSLLLENNLNPQLAIDSFLLFLHKNFLK